MRKLFSLMVVSLLSSSVCHAEPKSCPRNVISNLPECIANAVFAGKDIDMPEGKDYEIALEPPRNKDGKAVIPHTITEALKVMRMTLPNWYINALLRSNGDEECNVTVNRYSYGGLVTTWFFVQWELDDSHSPLRRQFEGMGIHTDDDVEQALMWGLCDLVKHDEQKALETIRQRGVVGKSGL